MSIYPMLRRLSVATALLFPVTSGAQQHVRDASGAILFRYQPDLPDSLGRTVTLSLRKLF